MIHRLLRFWAALDTVPGWATDGRAWRESLGDEWRSAARYLRPTGRMVAAIDCPSPAGDGCPRAVVRLPDGRLRAVCGESPRGCVDLDLAETDVAVLALDRAKLASEISAALEAPSDGTAVPRHSGVIPIGRHAVAAGISFPIALVLGGPDVDGVEQQLGSTALAAEAGIVAMPTASTLPTAAQARLRATGHMVLVLADVLGVDEAGRFQAMQPVDVILEAPRSRLLRKLKEPELPPVWALPRDARWAEVTFRLTADQEIDCAFRGETRRLGPDSLRMWHQRSRKPNSNLDMLKMLAHGRGELPINDSEAEDQIRSRARLLGDALADAFRISPSPIQWEREAGCYRAEFVISDERPLAVRRNFAGATRRR